MAVITNSGAPVSFNGSDGDYYIDLSVTPYGVYGPKASGAWPSEMTAITAIYAAAGGAVSSAALNRLVADIHLAIAQQADAGGWDMLKSTYDPTGSLKPIPQTTADLPAIVDYQYLTEAH